MGHTTTEVTDRFYSRFSKDDVREVVMRVGDNDNSSLKIDSSLLEEFREFQVFKKWQKENNQFS